MAKRRELPSQEVLRWTYDYDPATGFLLDKLSKKRLHVCYNKHGTGYIHFGDRTVPVNRVVWKWVHGTEPEVVAVKNGKSDDHRLENLEPRTAREHLAHARWRAPKRTTVPANQKTHARSGVKGVVWLARGGGRWLAKGDQKNGKKELLGEFVRKRDAIAARRAWEQGKPPLVVPRDPGAARRGRGEAKVAGVCRARGKWVAYTAQRGAMRQRVIGRYATMDEAIAARKKWEEENGAA